MKKTNKANNIRQRKKIEKAKHVINDNVEQKKETKSKITLHFNEMI